MSKMNESENPQHLPEPLLKTIELGFKAQATMKDAESTFLEAKALVKKFLDQEPAQYAQEMAEGLQCPLGKVIFVERASWEFDKRKLLGLLEKGEITIETLIHLASFNAEKLEAAIGEKAFKRIASSKTTQSMSFRPGKAA